MKLIKGLLYVGIFLLISSILIEIYLVWGLLSPIMFGTIGILCIIASLTIAIFSDIADNDYSEYD